MTSKGRAELQRPYSAVGIGANTATPGIGETETHFIEKTHMLDDGLSMSVSRRERLVSSVLDQITHELPCAQIGDYQVLEQLGEGGMGVVVRAKHLLTGEQVAIKLMRDAIAWNPGVRQRFFREVCALQKVASGEPASHLVKLISFGNESGKPFFVMEHVDGRPLSQSGLMATVPQSPDKLQQICDVVLQAAQGMKQLHEAGLIHRDIKPSNIMVAVDGHVKILDLGIVRIVTTTTTGTTPSDLTGGGPPPQTDGYAAPEVRLNSHSADHRADIYSLGSTFYRALTGATPEPLSPIPVRKLNSHVSDSLADLVHKMIAFQPDDRFQSASEVIEALKAACVDKSKESGHLERELAARTPRAFSKATWGIAALSLSFAMIVLLGVLTITTKNGTIEVEIPEGGLPADLRISVEKDGSEVVVLQKDNHWTARIAAGRIRLDLKGGDDRFELTESTLHISRLGRSVVQIRMIVPPAAKGGDAGNERALAERIIKLGGGVRVAPPGTPETVWDGGSEGASSWVIDDEELPTTEFSLFAVHLENSSRPDGRIVNDVFQSPHVAHVFLGPTVSDGLITPLNTISKSVRIVIFRGSNITPQAIPTIAGWNQLVHLGVEDNPSFDDNCVEQLVFLKNLYEVHFVATSITDKSLQIIGEHMPAMQNVILRRLEITDNGILNLTKLQSLSSVILEDCPHVTSDGIKAFAARAPQCSIEFNGEIVQSID